MLPAIARTKERYLRTGAARADDRQHALAQVIKMGKLVALAHGRA